MSRNDLKKMMIFSSEKIKLIVENIISDEVAVESRSASALYEKHILNDLLPKNESASMWLKLLYDGSWGVGEVLNACFSYLSGGINWEAKYDNSFELVRWAHHWECMANNLPDENAPEMYHFLLQLDSIVSKLDEIAKQSTQNQYEIKKEADWAKELYKIAKNEPEYMRYCNIYQLLLNNWEVLKNWSITYRLLADLASMQKKWRNTEKTRYELTKLLKIISDEWD